MESLHEPCIMTTFVKRHVVAIDRFNCILHVSINVFISVLECFSCTSVCRYKGARFKRALSVYYIKQSIL